MSTPQSVVTTGHPPDPILPHERLVALGMTGTGKSEFLLSLFAQERGQRLLVDVNDAYTLGPDAVAEEAQQVHGNPEHIDWRNRTIRYVPGRAGASARDEFDALYGAIWQRGMQHEQLGPLTVVLDESYGPTTANYAPGNLLLVLTQGRKKRIRHLAAALRPVNIAPELLTQSEHMALFDVGGRRDDLDAIGQRLGWNGKDVGDELRRLGEQYGYTEPDGRYRCHAYLRHRLGRREVVAFPPLPDAIRDHTRRSIVNDT